ncbi:MAG: type II toxin-antitoxin system death-on-curing family toxin [Syntrophomonadaceae bacterium]|nr:type II toxin-antitoxin system death-on-curing family toxin [Syntrophomonadaceae bacterium]MDD3889875.1 type II toxin-antitoxin system death-on-curing family toxin [Syntrophomonadaceae bacterium]MDD4549924.1 type II toxin-antitoxin system death-on-curing family toxin [Syntrophomonadaceae bacterium]
MKNIKFLGKEFILYFHQTLINEYGGSQGLRDEGLLESALSQARMTIDGRYLHQDIFEMAAAYGFHICQNHAFIDGNKRLALVAMDTFLQMNGWELIADEKETYVTMLRLAAGDITKQQLTHWIKAHAISK